MAAGGLFLAVKLRSFGLSASPWAAQRGREGEGEGEGRGKRRGRSRGRCDNSACLSPREVWALHDALPAAPLRLYTLAIGFLCFLRRRCAGFVMKPVFKF